MENNWDILKPRVEEAIKKLRNIDGEQPQEIAQKVVELSAWLASVNKELVERQFWYHELLKRMIEEHNTAAKATIYAQATKEWKDYKECESYSKSMLEIIRGGRRFTKLAEGEYKESQY